MIIIFDTAGGLCNQFYDIFNGINFCLHNNINFTFRYCSFRNNDLTSWDDQPFEKLFDPIFLNEYNLFINYDNIKDKVTSDNCFNLDSKIASHIIFNDNSNLLNQFINLNKEYILLRNFWCLYKFRNIIDNNIFKKILPSKNILEKYNEIKKKIINENPYNFIHYRYEHDFSDYFQLKINTIDNILEISKFKNNEIPIYVAGYNIKKLISLNKNILSKDDDELLNFNFEEKGFIDYLFGLNSEECFGHSRSSFSVMINYFKNSSNYYDLQK